MPILSPIPPFALRTERVIADDGEDKCCSRYGETALALYLERLDIGHSALFLPLDVFVQLRRCHFFVVFLRYQEVARLKGDNGVELSPVSYKLAVVLEIAHHIVVDAPVVQCVPLYALGREARHEAFVFVELRSENLWPVLLMLS